MELDGGTSSKDGNVSRATRIRRRRRKEKCRVTNVRVASLHSKWNFGARNREQQPVSFSYTQTHLFRPISALMLATKTITGRRTGEERKDKRVGYLLAN